MDKLVALNIFFENKKYYEIVQLIDTWVNVSLS